MVENTGIERNIVANLDERRIRMQQEHEQRFGIRNRSLIVEGQSSSSEVSHNINFLRSR